MIVEDSSTLNRWIIDDHDGGLICGELLGAPSPRWL